MHCCHDCLMLWGPPTLKANLAGVCDQLFLLHSFCGRPRVPAACFLAQPLRQAPQKAAVCKSVGL